MDIKSTNQYCKKWIYYPFKTIQPHFKHFKVHRNSIGYNGELICNGTTCIDERTFANEKSFRQFIEKVSENTDVLGIYPNHIITPWKTPDDPEFFQSMAIYQHWSKWRKSGADMDMDCFGISVQVDCPTGRYHVVCAVDDGIKASHPDLKGNIWYNYHEIPNNGIDDDGNGYIDDFKGYNVNLTMTMSMIPVHMEHRFEGIIEPEKHWNWVSGINWNMLMAVNYGIADDAHALAAYAYPYQMRKLYKWTNRKGAFVVASAKLLWGSDNRFAKDAPLWCAMYDSQVK